jgi:hypothetical protein
MEDSPAFNYHEMPPVLPNTPVSFHNIVHVDGLPEGWQYQLEVIEADYVPDAPETKPFDPDAYLREKAGEKPKFDPNKPFEPVPQLTATPVH